MVDRIEQLAELLKNKIPQEYDKSEISKESMLFMDEKIYKKARKLYKKEIKLQAEFGIEDIEIKTEDLFLKTLRQ